VKGAKEELPQLDTGNNRQNKVNDRVEAYNELVLTSWSICIKHSTYLLEQSQQ
jgi:hypothetical protein